MGLFSMFGGKKHKKKYKLSSADKALLAQQQAVSKQANSAASNILNNYQGDAKRLEDAAYTSAKSRLDPQWAQDQQLLTNKLAGQGLPMDSIAYGNAFDDFSRQKNDAYQQALDASVAAGQNSANNSVGQVASLFGTGAPNYQMPLSIYQVNQARNSGGGGMSPYMSGLFKLGGTALGGWARSGFAT